jgi:phosphotransferase system IIB component
MFQTKKITSRVIDEGPFSGVTLNTELWYGYQNRKTWEEKGNIITVCTSADLPELTKRFMADVFDKEGTLLSKHADTVDIYETYFQNSARKTVLSTLKKKIDSNIPYKYYYLSTNKDFKIPKKITYNPTFIALLQENNPIINIYNEKGKLVSAKRFTEYAGYHRLAKRIESENIVDITQPITEINLHVDNSKKSVQVKVKKLSTNEIIKYPSVVKAVINTFGSYDTNIYKNVIKHMNRQSPYKGFLFIRDC